MDTFEKNNQYVKFCSYGFFKNLRFYDAFLLIFFLENDLSFSQIGLLYAIREITTNVLEVPSGILADSFGRKNALLGAFFLYILAFITFYFSANFYLLLLAMLLVGIGDAFRSGTHKGMIMDYLKIKGWEQHKISYYGHTRSWSQRGSAVSALLAGLLVFYTGSYRQIYLLTIIPYLLNIVNIYSYPEEINYSLKKKQRKRASVQWVIQHTLYSLQQGRVLRLVNSAALHSAFLKAIKDYIQPLLVNIALLLPFLTTLGEKNKSGLVIGMVYFIIFLLTATASRNAGKVAQSAISNLEQKTLLLGLFAGLLCGLLYHYGFWYLTLLPFVSIYVIENIRKPILTGLLSDNVPNEILTSVLSTQSFYSTLTTALLALSLGVLADYFGIGIALLFLSGLLILFTLLLGKLQANSPIS